MASDWRVDARRRNDEYLKDTNQYVGLGGLTLAITTGLAHAPLLAWIGAGLLLLHWHSRTASHANHLRALRAIHDREVRPFSLLRRGMTAVIGFGLLGVSAVGAFEVFTAALP